MANYYGKTRTNYFAVKDEERFKKIIDNLTAEDEIIVEQNEEGKWSIASYSSIDYCLKNHNGNFDCDLDAFFHAIKECIADNDAMIWLEIGNEKLRYFVAYCIVVTSKDVQQINLKNEAVNLAAKMLGVESFNTQLDY